MSHQTFRTGATIPVSGRYRIRHNAHRLPGTAILLEEEKFPSCAKCHGTVDFELVESDPSQFDYEPLRISELPLLPLSETHAVL